MNPKKQIRDEPLINKEHKLIYYEVKCNRKLNLQQDDLMWKFIYKICLWTVHDNIYLWFQYRILRILLGTNDYLCKIKI